MSIIPQTIRNFKRRVFIMFVHSALLGKILVEGEMNEIQQQKGCLNSIKIQFKTYFRLKLNM